MSSTLSKHVLALEERVRQGHCQSAYDCNQIDHGYNAGLMTMYCIRQVEQAEVCLELCASTSTWRSGRLSCVTATRCRKATGLGYVSACQA
jgi:hypothetical protein